MKCWYCGKDTMLEDMFLGKGWFKCQSCGATWVKMLELAQVALGSAWTDGAGFKHYKARQISKKRKAKK